MTRRARTAGTLGIVGAALVAVVATLVAAAATVDAQPADPGSGAAGSGGGTAGSGTAGSGTAGSGAAGSGTAGSGTAGSGAAGSGTAGSGTAGSGTADSGTAGSGSAGSGGGTADSGTAGSGSAAPRIIQLPTDLNAPAVNATASPTEVGLGRRFTVFITATFNDGVEVNLREPIDLGSAFEVRRKLSEDRPAGDGRRTREWQLEVTPWELGELTMPPIRITYTSFGKVGQVQTNAIRLRILGVLGDVVDDPKAMRGDHPPAELIARDWFWLWVGAIAAGAAAAAGLVLWLATRRRRRTLRLVAGVVAAPRRIDMTSERALERLLAIAASGVLDRDDDRKTGYAEMVEVIREYLGARYRVATLDLTSSELLRQLEPVAPAGETARVADWLERCDLVKYGGLRATATEAAATLDGARALVIATTQVQAAPGKAAA